MQNNVEISVKHVVFDLDGTLVDSAPSILESMLAAFNEEGIEPALPLTHEIVGPSLTVAMTSLLPEASLDTLPRLIKAFKGHYDESGYRETRIYKGVPEMLKELRKMGFSLHIATNKRILPTRKIVDYIGWADLFVGLYSLDYFEPVLQNKIELLQRLFHKLPETPLGKIYVGDRAEDGIAADSNNFRFLGASWGYGSSELESSNYLCVESPEQIIEIINREF
jgi:phosphoglycolate phosphatase